VITAEVPRRVSRSYNHHLLRVFFCVSKSSSRFRCPCLKTHSIRILDPWRVLCHHRLRQNSPRFCRIWYWVTMKFGQGTVPSPTPEPYVCFLNVEISAEKAVNERLAHTPELYLLALSQFAITADTEVVRPCSQTYEDYGREGNKH